MIGSRSLPSGGRMQRPAHTPIGAATRWVGLALLIGCSGSSAGAQANPTPGEEPAPLPAARQEPPPATQPEQRPVSQPNDPALAAAVRTFTALLKDVVTADGLVQYDVLAQPVNRRMLNEVLAHYRHTKQPHKKARKLAFLCNAYNANVLALVLGNSRKQGFASVTDVPGFFDRLTIVVASERMILNELENEHIRPLGDPRVHAALVCAAVSCPPLRREPYVADRLDEQLDDQCRRWINDPSKNRADDTALWLSAILKWYKDDFSVEPFNGRLGFLRAYADANGPITKYLNSVQQPKIRWLGYDWKLNQAPAPGEPSP